MLAPHTGRSRGWRTSTIGRAAAIGTILAGLVPSGAPAAKLGELRVAEAGVDTGAIYVEGAYGYASVRRARDGRLVRRWRTTRTLSRRLRLPAGYYRLDSWTRTCSGTCADLSPPTLGCHGYFRVRPGRHVTATIHSGVGIDCLITNP
jgi:hypothetical protein